MSTNKINGLSSKTSSYRCTNSRTSSAKSLKTRFANPRRVVPSRKVPQLSSNNRKALSTGLLNENKTTVKPKKTTKSEFSVPQDKDSPIDYCLNCGDALLSHYPRRVPSDSKSFQTVSTSTSKSDTKSRKSVTKSSTNCSTSIKSGKKGKTNSKYLKRSETIHQYYKNENYKSTESAEEISNGVKKLTLDTIKEVSEKPPSDSIFRIYSSESEDDVTYFDVDDQGSLEQLKEFRQKNYFECHSAKSRIKNKGSATKLQGHSCVYRFYLNERLFPVPLSTDHNNRVRCVECHLPMDLNVGDATKVNGTIQAKVTIGKKNQDIMLLLPVKEPLIITEKRKEEKPKDTEVVFFGVINLDGFGNSMFNSTLPTDSLALKYQKGYQEFASEPHYSYRDIDKADVIVI